MKDEMLHLEEILENLPAKPDRSRLDRYGRLIEEMLRAVGRTGPWRGSWQKDATSTPLSARSTILFIAD